MIDANFVELLRSSDGRCRLRMAEKPEIDWINEAIRSGVARDRAEQLVREPIEGGLIAETGEWIFPIREGIPTLLADDAIRVPPSITASSKEE